MLSIIVVVNLLIETSGKNMLGFHSVTWLPMSFTVVVPGDPIAAHVGSTVIVPCWISPPENAEALEIRWYRHDEFSSPVLLYNHGKLQDVQEEPYRNRSSLALRSDQSGGLKDGDVSLRLEKLRVQDEGSFHCYVSEHLSLLLSSALGSAPVLFPKPLDDGRVNISCRSSGWYPEPSVSWTSDDGRALRPGGSSHSRGADELFSVHSWTAVSLSDAQLVSCSVSLRTGECVSLSVSFTVVVPGDPIAAHVGSTVIVPCWISPPENAEALEIRWYRHDQFSNPVLLYNHGKIQDVQEEPYRNRTSLALRSDQQCFKQYTYYPACSFCVRRRSEHLSLLLSSALGSAPVLFPKPLDDGRVNISCRSSGWYPKPSVSWTSDDGRALRPGGSSHSRGADEMFSVHSWTAVSLSDAQLVSCSISLRTGELKEGRLNIQGIVSSG
uniref:Ig-like domain-containing protein n=1 Tax=Sinocyclocheilus anshuiensis TaxID=1608454 RepID=A0A671SFR8_9TELE